MLLLAAISNVAFACTHTRVGPKVRNQANMHTETLRVGKESHGQCGFHKMQGYSLIEGLTFLCFRFRHCGNGAEGSVHQGGEKPIAVCGCLLNPIIPKLTGRNTAGEVSSWLCALSLLLPACC